MNKPVAAIVCVAASMSAPALGATMYGLTATDLVRFESTNPGVVTIVGPHGLPNDGAGIAALAYHPGQGKLFGVYFGSLGADGYHQHLYSINPATGAGVLVADLGTSGVASQNVWESIEYVDALGTLVISRGLGSSSNQFYSISPTGATVPLASNGLDNDYSTYDPGRNIFYVIDPNGFGQLVTTNPSTGASSNQGSLGGRTVGDLAYHAGDDKLYGYDYSNNQLYRITTTNGVAPIAITNLGTIAGAQVVGLATIPSPCVGDINGDGATNTGDFNIFATNFGAGPGATPAQGDLTGDGFVNTADFNILAGDFGCS